MDECWVLEKPQHFKSLSGGISSYYYGTRDKYQIENLDPLDHCSILKSPLQSRHFWDCPVWKREGKVSSKTNRKRGRKL